MTTTDKKASSTPTPTHKHDTRYRAGSLNKRQTAAELNEVQGLEEEADPKNASEQEVNNTQSAGKREKAGDVSKNNGRSSSVNQKTTTTEPSKAAAAAATMISVATADVIGDGEDKRNVDQDHDEQMLVGRISESDEDMEEEEVVIINKTGEAGASDGEDEDDEEDDFTWTDLPSRPLPVEPLNMPTPALSPDTLIDSINLRQGRKTTAEGGGGIFREEKGLKQIECSGFSSSNLPPIDRAAFETEELREKNKDKIGTVELLNFIGPGSQTIQLASREVVTFVLVARSAGSEDLWLVPAEQMFFDLMGLVESAIMQEWGHFKGLIDWHNAWSTVGLLGVHSANTELLEEFRTALTTKCYKGKEFNTYPKESLTKSPDFTVVLKRKQRTYNIQGLAESIITSNRRLLAGSLYPTHLKVYTKADKTRHGESKAGWRLIVLKGDKEMIEALERTDEDQLFKFGSGHLQIQGGKRRNARTSSLGRYNSRQRRSGKRSEFESRGTQQFARRHEAGSSRYTWKRNSERYDVRDRSARSTREDAGSDKDSSNNNRDRRRRSSSSTRRTSERESSKDRKRANSRDRERRGERSQETGVNGSRDHGNTGNTSRSRSSYQRGEPSKKTR